MGFCFQNSAILAGNFVLANAETSLAKKISAFMLQNNEIKAVNPTLFAIMPKEKNTFVFCAELKLTDEQLTLNL